MSRDAALEGSLLTVVNFVGSESMTIIPWHVYNYSDGGSVSLGSQGQEQRPAEVIAQLESLLSTTAEELEQQRRLNQALIKRKVLSETMMIAMITYYYTIPYLQNFKDNQIK